MNFTGRPHRRSPFSKIKIHSACANRSFPSPPGRHARICGQMSSFSWSAAVSARLPSFLPPPLGSPSDNRNFFFLPSQLSSVHKSSLMFLPPFFFLWSDFSTSVRFPPPFPFDSSRRQKESVLFFFFSSPTIARSQALLCPRGGRKCSSPLPFFFRRSGYWRALFGVFCQRDQSLAR